MGLLVLAALLCFALSLLWLPSGYVLIRFKRLQRRIAIRRMAIILPVQLLATIVLIVLADRAGATNPGGYMLVLTVLMSVVGALSASMWPATAAQRESPRTGSLDAPRRMNTLDAVLLILEVLICFGPQLPTLMLGLLFSPALVVAPFTSLSMTLFALLPFGGVAGCLGIWWLLKKSIAPAGSVPRPRMIFACIFVGIAALLGAVVAFQMPLPFVVSALPLAATAHLLYLTRRYMFRHQDAPPAPEPL